MVKLKRFNKLKTRKYTIFQKFFFLGIIPVMIIFSFTYVDFMIRYREMRIIDEELILSEKLETSATYLDGFVSKIESIPKSLAQNPIIRNIEENLFPDYFEELLQVYPEIHNVYVAYESNGNLTVTHRNGSLIQTDIYPPSEYVNQGELWYDLPIEQEQFVIQKAYFDHSFMQVWMVSFLNPVYDYNGKLIGMVGCDITLEELHNLVHVLTAENEFKAFILEDTNITLAIQDTSYYGKSFYNYTINKSESELFTLVSSSTINSSHIFTGSYTDSAGEENYIYGLQLENENIDWKLFITVSRSVVLEETTDLLLLLGIVGFILIGVVGTILFLISRSITQPINSLANVTKKIAGGDFDAQIEIRSSGEIQTLILNFQKMVARIQAQISHLQAVSDLAPAPIVMVSKEGKINYINNQFIQVYGYSLTDIPTTEEWFLKAYPDSKYRAETMKIWQKYLDSKESILNVPIKFSVTAKSGEKIATGFKLVHLENGGQYMTMENETERQKQEEEKLFQQKTESISLLAGGIAHDFNNVLMGILGNINLLQLEDNLDVEHYQILSQLEKAVLRGSGLTKQLLTFSKGGMPIKKIQSIEPLIKDSLSFVMTGSNSIYELDLEPNLPHVNIDAGQIGQVLNNLIINSQQAMPDGGLVEVGASLRTIPKNNEKKISSGDYLEISIKDSGRGIPLENQIKIFSPYFTTKSKGNGLGLATAYAILKKHDGNIQFQSELGKGTTFYLYIPVSFKKQFSSKSNHTSQNSYSGKVLILDDDLIILNTVTRLLNKLGFSVDQATEGNALIEKYNHALETGTPYTFIITDLTIPGGMGGKEAMKIIQRRDPTVKAIVSSGYSNDPILSNYREFGFIAVLNKPYTIQELKDVLHSIL